MDRVPYEAVRLADGVAADMHVTSAANHPEEPKIVWVHPRAPDSGRSHEAPGRPASIRTPPDLFGLDFALSVYRRRIVIFDGAGLVAGCVHELRRRAHDSLNVTIPCDRRRQVFHARDVRGVVGKARPVNVRDGGEVRDGIRSHLVNRALKGGGIEQVADLVLDACNRRERHASVESEHRMTPPDKQLREMKPDETSVSRDENFQQGLRFDRLHPVILRGRRATILRLVRSAVAEAYLAVD